jgi:2-iminobutanoate/2-iminopropanoate deaminase
MGSVVLMPPKIEKVVTFPWNDERGSSEAIRVGDLVFVSGQGAIGERGEVVSPGESAPQAEKAFANLKGVLEAAGSRLDLVVRTTTYVSDVSARAAVEECRRKYFSDPYPTDTTVVVESLGQPGLLVKIDAVALAA